MEKPQSNRVLQHYRQETAELLKKRQEGADNAKDEEKVVKMPKRAEYRMRAHCNPLSDTPFPLSANKPTESRPRRLESALSHIRVAVTPLSRPFRIIPQQLCNKPKSTH